MDPALLQLTAVTKFLIYFGTALFLTILFAFIYAKITPYQEIKLIREGNTAAAYSMSGALLGFVIPLASAIVHSVSLLDMAVWGIVALVVQLTTYFVVSRVFSNLADEIRADRVGKGLFLGAVSVIVGILNAASMSY